MHKIPWGVVVVGGGGPEANDFVDLNLFINSYQIAATYDYSYLSVDVKCRVTCVYWMIGM